MSLHQLPSSQFSDIQLDDVLGFVATIAINLVPPLTSPLPTMSLLHLDTLSRKLAAKHLEGTRIWNLRREETFRKDLEDDLRKGGGMAQTLQRITVTS